MDKIITYTNVKKHENKIVFIFILLCLIAVSKLEKDCNTPNKYNTTINKVN